MQAEHGTTYNSYLVKGDEKIAIIDAVKAKFFPDFIGNVKSLVDPEDIDYFVVNHTEPDHSGSLASALEVMPNAVPVISKTCKHFLKNILNRDADTIIVQDDDNIDLGGKTLQFVHAPFLHWPDTMFTYVVENKVLLPCDFSGSHYCDDRLFDDLVGDFSHAFRYYYDVIFRPFKEYVLKALDKIEGLNIDVIAPSHGPVLRTEPRGYLEKYREWSLVPESADGKKMLVFYASAYGNTQALAEGIAEGARAEGLTVAIFDITAVDPVRAANEIEAADAVIVGSATINGDAVKPVWDLLSSLATLKLRGKLGGAFGSYGWSGEGPVMIHDRLKGLRLKTPLTPYRVTLVPTAEDLAGAEEFGRALAREALK